MMLNYPVLSIAAGGEPEPGQYLLVPSFAVQPDKTLCLFVARIAQHSDALRHIVCRQRNAAFDGNAVMPAGKVERKNIVSLTLRVRH